MHKLNSLTTVILTCALLGLVYTPVPAMAASAEMEKLIKLAKQEGQITLYTALNPASAKRVIAGFEKKYGIRVEFTRAPGTVLLTKFEQELAVKRLEADAYVGANVAHTDDIGRRGLLVPLADAIPAEVLDVWPKTSRTDYYAIAMVIPRWILYNTDLVKPDEIKTWKDLLDPKWKTKMIVGDPRGTSTYAITYWMLRELYGQEFLVKLAAQKPRFVTSATTGAQSIAAGDAALLVTGGPNHLFNLKAKGAPIAGIELKPTNGSEIIACVLKEDLVKHYNAGRLFITYLLSPEGNGLLNNKIGATPLKIEGVLEYPDPYYPQSPELMKKVEAWRPELNKILGVE